MSKSANKFSKNAHAMGKRLDKHTVNNMRRMHTRVGRFKRDMNKSFSTMFTGQNGMVRNFSTGLGKMSNSVRRFTRGISRDIRKNVIQGFRDGGIHGTKQLRGRPGGMYRNFKSDLYQGLRDRGYGTSPIPMTGQQIRERSGKGLENQRKKLNRARQDMYSGMWFAAPLAYPAYSGVKYEDKLFETAKLFGKDAGWAKQKGLDLLSLQRGENGLNINKTQIAGVMSAAGRLGVSEKDLKGFTRESLLTAKAFEMGNDAESVATRMARIKQQFDMSDKQIARFADGMNILGNFGEFAHKDLLRAFERGGGMMAKKGFTGSQSATLFSMGLIGGYGPERTGRMTAGLLNTISAKGASKGKAGAKFRDQMDEMGFSYEKYTDYLDKGNSFGAVIGLMKSMEDYKKRWKDPNVGARHQQELIANMFPRGQQMILAFMSNWKLLERQVGRVLDQHGQLKEWTEINGQKVKVYGSRQKEVIDRQKSAWEQLKKAWFAFDRSMTKAGFHLLDPIKSAAGGLANVFNNLESAIDNNSGAAKGLIYGLTGSLALIGGAFAARVASIIAKIVGLRAASVAFSKVSTLLALPFTKAASAMAAYLKQGGLVKGMLRGGGLIGGAMLAYDMATNPEWKPENINKRLTRVSNEEQFAKSRISANQPANWAERLNTYSPAHWWNRTGAWSPNTSFGGSHEFATPQGAASGMAQSQANRVMVESQIRNDIHVTTDVNVNDATVYIKDRGGLAGHAPLGTSASRGTNMSTSTATTTAVPAGAQ